MTGFDTRLRVLVTRAEPDASVTARRLKALGHEAEILPLFETRALDAGSLGLPTEPGIVAATSANALRHTPRELVTALADVACYCVGKKTAKAAREAGFLHVHDAGSDAEGLARQIIAAAGGKTVTYLCGRVRRPTFEDQLKAAGYAVSAIETYDTVPIDISHVDEFLAAVHQPIDAALVYSALSAEVLASFVQNPDAIHLFENVIYLCLSSRVADAMKGLGLRRIITSAEPTEDALLSLLGEVRRELP